MTALRRLKVSRKIHTSGLLELVGRDEILEPGKYSGSVGFVIDPPSSGELLGAALYVSEEGSGDIQEVAGRLLVFGADPETPANAPALTTVARKAVLAATGVALESCGWSADANGGSVIMPFWPPAPFHKVSALYVVWELWGATSLNDAEADDEILQVNIWYERSGDNE